MGRDTKKGVITSPAKDANALRDLIKRAESNYQTFVNEQGVANAELVKNSLNGTLLKTQTLMEMSEEEREKLKARCEAIRSIETYKGSLFVSSATVFRMIRSIYNKGIAHEEDTHGSFRLFPYRPNWNIDVYNLEMVIRLTYSIDNDNSRKFRQFIMNRLMGKPMYENVCVTLNIGNYK